MSSQRSTYASPAPPENKLAGEKAEAKFKCWMDVNHIPHYRIDQEPDTLALAFKGLIRRPDYIIRMKPIGATIAADVKSRRYDVDYEDFIVSEEDVSLLAAFQELFGFPVWIVLSTPAIQWNTWYWIALDTIIATIPVKTSSKSGDQFRPVRIDQCKTVGSSNGLGSIFF